ncbi:MAG: hypothetical protein LUD24_00740 [Phascolarctobacterium sp.]|nr:hypothetical protein [Phascolarctobacterium sp.]
MSEREFPIPRRINYIPSPLEPDEDGVLDIGFHCGNLKDGRPYRLECWAMDEIIMVTVMFSDMNIRSYLRQDMYDLLKQEKLVDYISGKKPLQFARTHDDAGNSMWMLNIMLADGKGRYAKLKIKLQSYK